MRPTASKEADDLLPEKRWLRSGFQGLDLNLERGTGLEPATACLEGRSSTTELPPLEGTGALPVLSLQQAGRVNATGFDEP